MSVVLIGSSGGGGATLGHTDVPNLLQTIHSELQRISIKINAKSNVNKTEGEGCGIRLALFVSCESTMDSANPGKDLATLWTLGIPTQNGDGTVNDKPLGFQVSVYCTGLLKEVNEKAKHLEKKFLVPAILAEDSSYPKILGLISISSDPKNVNHASLAAAASAGVPITGSGGTSLSTAVTIHNGLKLVGNAGGSVATTTYTRAVSYCFALSNAWGNDYNYTPFNNPTNNSINNRVKPHIGSILDACLPSFLAVCVTCRILETLQHILPTPFFGNADQLLSNLQYQALPSVCSVVAATSLAPEHGSTAVMAAGLASMSCWGSVVSGLLAGWIVSFLLGRTLFVCIKFGIPATMTNILVAGFVGSSVALIFSTSGIVTLLSSLTQYLRIIIRMTPSCGPWGGGGYGFLFGCLFCYGSKVGWYHAIFLPVILMEMERGEASMWGSVDECALVMVSAGICAANILTSNEKDVSLPWRGLKINTACGDFIEVAYPFMESSMVVNVFAYIACGISTEVLYQSENGSVLSSAYFPLPISLFLAEDRFRMALASGLAFFISFLGMIVGNTLQSRQKYRDICESDKVQ